MMITAPPITTTPQNFGSYFNNSKAATNAAMAMAALVEPEKRPLRIASSAPRPMSPTNTYTSSVVVARSIE